MLRIEDGNRTRPERETSAPTAAGGLHPRVYATVIGLAAWFVLSVWIFAGGGVSDYLLFVVSGFIFISVALPLILASVNTAADSPSGAPPPRDAKRQSFHDWAAGNFATWGGSLSGRQAMVQVLLPFMAVAFGMTLFGVILHLAV
jgi:hypothetical protein